jgi:hypothetical protein
MLRATLAWIFRDADWLTAERARAWVRVLAVLLAVRVAAWLILPQGGDIIGGDFICYWAAAGFAASGHAALAYNDASMSAVEHAQLALPPNAGFAFFYPPGFLLLLLPLGGLSFRAALVAFQAATFVPYFASLRRMLPQRWALLPILAFPGVLVAAGTGQNGFLSAACLGGYMVLLDEQPFLAGACLGLLSYKPHLAMYAPIAMLASRRWRAMAGAAVSATVLAGSSLLVLGVSAWAGFLQALPRAGEMMVHGLIDTAKLQSTYGAFRIMHLPIAASAAAQAVISVGALAVLARVVWRRPGGRAEGAMLAAATLVCSPYSMDYDLAILGLPLAWLLAEAIRRGFRPWEKILLLLAYMLPISSHGLAALYDVPVAPVVLVAILALTAGRCLREGHREIPLF